MMATGNDCTRILKDVVAYVDVWSSKKTENYSKSFIQQLQQMGAQVSKTFTKQVTHVVFKDGHHVTWKKAKKTGVKLVSVLWVARCNDVGEFVDEELFPAINDEHDSALKKRTHRCMQPKDSPENTPDNNRRMKIKLDKMMQGFVRKSPIIADISGCIIDEEHGIVYSPLLKRSDSMARRLKEMKENRVNLSLTASQMLESSSSPVLEPDLGTTPTLLKLLAGQSDDESAASVPAPSPDGMLSHYLAVKEDEIKLCHDTDNFPLEPLHREISKKPWLSPCSHVPKRISFKSGMPFKLPDLDFKEVEMRHKIISGRCSIKKDHVSKDNSFGLLQVPRQHDRSTDPENGHKKLTPSQLNFYSCASGKSGQSPNNSKIVKAPPPIIGNSVVDPEQSEGKSLKREEPIAPKLSGALFSALTQPFTLSRDSSSVASSSVQDDDGLFEDYFSVANCRQMKQRPLLPTPPSENRIQVPFELESVSGKRKERNAERTGSESAPPEKRKPGLIQNAGKASHQSNDMHSEPQRHPRHRQVPESFLSADTPDDNAVAPATRRNRRKSSGPNELMSPSDLDTHSTKHRTMSTPIQPPPSRLISASAACDLQRTSAAKVHPQSTQCGGSERTVETAGPTEAEDQQGYKKMDKKLKTVRTLVMTSLSTDKQRTVSQVVKVLGGFSIEDRVCETTTHVVSGGYRRTLNILLGIARGCWILSFEWILCSLEQRQWIPEEPYELSDHFPAAPICRLQQHLSAGEHQQDLFQGQPAMFVSQHSQPPIHSLVELIQLCGGTVCKSVRQAGICIGKYSGRRAEGSRLLSEQWVLDCITHLKTLSYESYTLE